MIKRSICFFILFFLTAITNAYASTKGDNNVLMNKPYVTVNINAHGCAYQILINDVPIMTDERGIPVTVDIPVNEWLKSGSNTLSMKLTPVKEANVLAEQQQSCSATATLQVRQSGTPDNDNQVISKIHYQAKPDDLTTDKTAYAGSSLAGDFNSKDGFKANDEGNVKVSIINIEPLKGKHGEGIDIKRTITMPLPFPEWEWFSGEKIPDDQQTKNALIKQYEKIWHALQNKNIQSITSLFKNKSIELSEAYFTQPNRVSIIPSLEDSIHNPDLKLVKFLPQYAKLQVFGDGRLAKLTTWNGHSDVIAYNYTNMDANRSFSIVFMKLDNRWVIIR